MAVEGVGRTGYKIQHNLISVWTQGLKVSQRWLLVFCLSNWVDGDVVLQDTGIFVEKISKERCWAQIQTCWFFIWPSNCSSTVCWLDSYLHWITFAPWSKISWLYFCGSIAGLSILFHLSICLFWPTPHCLDGCGFIVSVKIGWVLQLYSFISDMFYPSVWILELDCQYLQKKLAEIDWNCIDLINETEKDWLNIESSNLWIWYTSPFYLDNFIFL